MKQPPGDIQEGQRPGGSLTVETKDRQMAVHAEADWCSLHRLLNATHHTLQFMLHATFCQLKPQDAGHTLLSTCCQPHAGERTLQRAHHSHMVHVVQCRLHANSLVLQASYFQSHAVGLMLQAQYHRLHTAGLMLQAAYYRPHTSKPHSADLIL